MSKIIKYIQKMFHTKSHTRYQSDLDVYVSSKHPKTAADVDYWVRQYDSVMHRRGGLHGNYY
mgnify:CR=1